MATKKSTGETVPAMETMNVWAKLQAVRTEFYAAGAKKSGKNLHAEFMYFELADIVPLAAPIFAKYGLLMLPTFIDGQAVARIVNIDKPDETIEFSIPLQFIAEPGKFRMNEVQGVGAVVTYYRRYLYMVVLDLVESDTLDEKRPKSGDEGNIKPLSPSPKKGKTSVSATERKTIKEELTDTEGKANELQIEGLKKALKKLMEFDPEQESFVQEIAIKTNAFTEISKAQCEVLVSGINEMIATYEEGKS